jgi:hypothetical protein
MYAALELSENMWSVQISIHGSRSNGVATEHFDRGLRPGINLLFGVHADTAQVTLLNYAGNAVYYT